MDIVQLRKLAHIILESLDELESITTKTQTTLPNVDTPITDLTELRAYANIQAPAAAIKAACGQLTANIAPSAVLADAYWGHILSSCLKVAITINVAEVLREAGPQGGHVRDICKYSDTDPQKIARVLRLLASNHIFREVAPDVFANNRLSSVFDSGSSIHDLFYDPDRKRSDRYLSPRAAYTAQIELIIDDMFAATSKLTEFLTEPATAHSTKPTDAPMNIAFETPLPIMEWHQLPENELRRTRFHVAMTATSTREGALPGFDWARMEPGSKIVDVGGGYGVLFLSLAREHPHLKYIVQDQPKVLADAADFWKEKNPEALENDCIQFQAQDFFKPQLVPDATLFIVRQVLHNWSDPYALQMLRHLRAAAQPTTRLAVICIEVPMACATEPMENIPRHGFPEWVSSPPKPLLPNYGTGRLRPYFLDLLMMLGFNGQERTIQDHQRLLHEAGWEIEAVYHIRESGNLQIVSRPKEA